MFLIENVLFYFFLTKMLEIIFVVVLYFSIRLGFL